MYAGHGFDTESDADTDMDTDSVANIINTGAQALMLVLVSITRLILEIERFSHPIIAGR